MSVVLVTIDDNGHISQRRFNLGCGATEYLRDQLAVRCREAGLRAYEDEDIIFAIDSMRGALEKHGIPFHARFQIAAK